MFDFMNQSVDPQINSSLFPNICNRANILNSIFNNLSNLFKIGFKKYTTCLMINPNLCLFFSSGEVIHLRDIKDFPLTLWLIFAVCVMYYVAVFPFIGLGM